jgi:alkylhydroperoxidase family enzyme
VPRISPVDPASPPGSTDELFEKIRARFGTVPNSIRVLANSPAALTAWWEFQNAMQDSTLVREKLAVLSGNATDCGYALAAHPATTNTGEPTGESEAAADAALAFGVAVVRDFGAVPDEVIDAARAAGLTDAQLVEVVAVVIMNTFTSVFGRLAAAPNGNVS